MVNARIRTTLSARHSTLMASGLLAVRRLCVLRFEDFSGRGVQRVLADLSREARYLPLFEADIV